jgi:hypothetical protein
MDVVKNEIIKELSKKYNKKEKNITIMLEKSFELGYNNEEAKENIIEFIVNSCQQFVNNEQNI